jgi:DNA-binding NtrC family response regulator
MEDIQFAGNTTNVVNTLTRRISQTIARPYHHRNSLARRFRYKVLLARNGKEALEIYLKERDNISLVILDLIMPEMGGKLCMKELFEIDPTARILVASGYESGGGPLDARQAGAAGFIRKPFNVTQILQTVRKIIDS